MILANRINGRVSGRTKQPANATYARARARVYEIYFCLSYNFSRLILHFVKVNNNVSCAFQNAVCEIFVIYVFITRTGISGGREGGISEFFEVFSIRPSRIERYEYCAMNFWLTDSSDSSWYLPLKIVLACHMGRHKVHRSTWYPCSRFVRFAVVVSRKEKEKEEKKKKDRRRGRTRSALPESYVRCCFPSERSERSSTRVGADGDRRSYVRLPLAITAIERVY